MMSKSKLTKLTDFELLSELANHIEHLSGDDYEFWMDCEEANSYQQRFSPRVRDRMITLLLGFYQEESSKTC